MIEVWTVEENTLIMIRFFMCVSLQWDNKWVFLQIRSIYVMWNENSPYFFCKYMLWILWWMIHPCIIFIIIWFDLFIYLDIVMFNQNFNLPSQKTTNLSLVRYARHLQYKFNLLKPCPSTTNCKHCTFFKQCENFIYLCVLMLYKILWQESAILLQNVWNHFNHIMLINTIC